MKNIFFIIISRASLLIWLKSLIKRSQSVLNSHDTYYYLYLHIFQRSPLIEKIPTYNYKVTINAKLLQNIVK